jgi:hypothetical protein
MSTKTSNSPHWSANLTESGFEVHTLVRGIGGYQPSLMIMIVNPQHGHGYIVYLLSNMTHPATATTGRHWYMMDPWNMEYAVHQGSRHPIETLRHWWNKMVEAGDTRPYAWEVLHDFKALGNRHHVVAGIEKCVSTVRGFVDPTTFGSWMSMQEFLKANPRVFGGMEKP